MRIHVAHQVGAVLEGLLAHRALVGPLRAVRPFVVHQVGRLAEALVTQRALVRLLTCVDALVPGQLREVLEGFLTDGAAVGLLRGVKRLRMLCLGRLVGFLTDRALHGVAVVDIVMLRQRGQEGEAHLADATHKGLLLYLDTLVFEEVGGLVEDLQALGTLERAVMAWQALVLMGVGEVSEVVATHTAFVGRLSSLDGGVLVVLQARVRLEQDAVDGTAQGVVSSAGRDGVLWQGSCPSVVLLRRRLLWLLLLLLPAF